MIARLEVYGIESIRLFIRANESSIPSVLILLVTRWAFRIAFRSKK